jgi:hypothetical protein
MKIIFKVLGLFFFTSFVQMTFAAFDFKVSSWKCESKDNSTVTVNCSTTGKSASISVNFSKPQNNLMVRVKAKSTFH